jgi:phytoene dehydrogenase-like protein
MVFLWGMNRKIGGLAHHNVIFSDDYAREFYKIAIEQRIADDPTVYISIPSKSDDTLDQHDGESWFVLVNMPYTRERQDWQAWTARTREAVRHSMKRAGIDISDAIEFEHVITPPDFERMYGANRGSIYGLSSNSRSSAFKRPANRSRDLKGLYFAGGSTHPGGGIPLVMLSANIAAGLVEKYELQHKTAIQI